MRLGRNLLSITAVLLAASFGVAPNGDRPWPSTSESTESTLQAQRPFREAKPTVDLSMEQRHVIKELIKDIPSAQQDAGRAGEDVNLSIGTPVPPTVKLQPFSAEIVKKVPAVRAHSFFLKDNQVVVVDTDKKIAEIIE